MGDQGEEIEYGDDNVKVYDNDEAYMLNDDQDDMDNEKDSEDNDQLAENSPNEDEHQLDNQYNNQKEQHQINEYEEEEEDEQVTVKQPYGNQLSLNPEAHQDQIKEEEEYGNLNDNNEYEPNSINSNEEVSEIPLIPLKYLSICQCCKEPFNSSINLPYLFSCGHFFCKLCIRDNFTDEEGIKCPSDGLVANSLAQLKVLTNLINDNNTIEQSNRGKYCEVHKRMGLTHYVEDTKELICVYCAFSKFKKNPKIEIKELKEKASEVSNVVNKIIEDNQHYVEMLQESLSNIKRNKETEYRRAINFFDQIISVISMKKDEAVAKINSIFTENAKKLSNQLEIFSNRIDNAEKVKEQIQHILQKNDSEYFTYMMDMFNKMRDNEKNNHSLQLQEYKFIIQDDEMNKIQSFGQLKLLSKQMKFGSQKDEEDSYLKKYYKTNSFTTDVLNSSEVVVNESKLNTNTQNGKDSQSRYSKNKLNSSGSHHPHNNKKGYNKPTTPGDYKGFR